MRDEDDMVLVLTSKLTFVVWVVEINMISVWRIELDLVLCGAENDLV